jgi:hypothetical protein
MPRFAMDEDFDNRICSRPAPASTNLDIVRVQDGGSFQGFNFGTVGWFGMFCSPQAKLGRTDQARILLEIY